jgi:hypothetical protein
MQGRPERYGGGGGGGGGGGVNSKIWGPFHSGAPSKKKFPESKEREPGGARQFSPKTKRPKNLSKH